jgi:hypothetical protein
MPAQPAADLLIATGTPTQLRYLLSRLSVQIAEADFAAPAYVDQKCCARSYDGSLEKRRSQSGKLGSFLKIGGDKSLLMT